MGVTGGLWRQVTTSKCPQDCEEGARGPLEDLAVQEEMQGTSEGVQLCTGALRAGAISRNQRVGEFFGDA